MEQSGGRAFLTDHARVLPAIARDPSARFRGIAAACHITERTAQKIVCDLEEAGHLSRKRDGRRTRCTLHLDSALRHPGEAHLTVRSLLTLVPAAEQPAVRAALGVRW
ncbi:MarR family transcriptional regulator [Streptomyces sp. NRRL S-340]|uniref:MarR family transcriptional regulator n=1 Tax=Streptomyces sp. NRRL S-340 TaxID=1463901 RepID=UPI00069027B9|nr:MarR family transcriptional regulator [Streptomyces sp. NRRL S-340]